MGPASASGESRNDTQSSIEMQAAAEARMMEARKKAHGQKAVSQLMDTKTKPLEKHVTVTPPVTFQSWLFGIVNGGRDSWLMRYMESEFYELARTAIKDRTGADIHMVMMGCAALNAARIEIPAMLNTVLDQIKTQVTSSIVISGIQGQLFKELLDFAHEKSEENRSSKFRFSGEHHFRKATGELVPLSGNFSGSFWHDGTHFTLEVQDAPDANPEENMMSRSVNPSSNLVIRCFGRSHGPILALLEHVQKRISQSLKLRVIEVRGRQNKLIERNKRPLDTVDLDPLMMQEIIQDVELFFHKDSQIWYENTGRPWRHGYLLHGPPGTGKSSLIAAIASHVNAPLYLINLQGMNDEDLKEAFSLIPAHICVALEDIDCIGADIGNRTAAAAQVSAQVPEFSTNSTASVNGVFDTQSQADAIESVLTTFMERQAFANQQVIKQVSDIKSATYKYFYEDESPPANEYSEENSLTLSGLLNVLDGVNASEGRLVIMTTNHPEKLDPALYRAGRVERKFEITYASKASSILTFKRLFANDVCKRYTSEAIDRFAQAFQAQFPSKSRITTAELAKYCGQYRGRPDIAVKEFADWIERGADKFVIPVDYTKVVDEEGVNVPEPFDRDLLMVSASDLVDPNTAATSGIEVVIAEVQPVASSSSWRPFTAMANLLVDSGEYTDLSSIQDSLAHAESEAPTSDRRAHFRERCVGLGLVTPQSSVPAQEPILDDEFDDADFADDEAFSL